MYPVKRMVSGVLVLVLVLQSSLWAGLGSKKTMYVGGTVKTLREKDEGYLSTDDEKALVFRGDKKAQWQIPYEKVTSLAYGQHAGRRVGATIGWGVTTLGVAALPILFSKKRRHYLTIEYTDEGGQSQAAIFEVGKDVVRVTVKTLEVRTGKQMEYEDEEAKKAGNK